MKAVTFAALLGIAIGCTGTVAALHMTAPAGAGALPTNPALPGGVGATAGHLVAVPGHAATTTLADQFCGGARVAGSGGCG